MTGRPGSLAGSGTVAWTVGGMAGRLWGASRGRRRGVALLTVTVILALFLAGCSGSVATPGGGEGGAGDGQVLSIILDGAKNREAELQVIAQYLQQIGIDARVRVWEYQTLVAEA
ncbi:MAG TPA: peptide ABC transporter substrate-binding protein, partial [Thermaerobacter sp.]